MLFMPYRPLLLLLGLCHIYYGRGEVVRSKLGRGVWAGEVTLSAYSVHHCNKGNPAEMESLPPTQSKN